MILTKLTLHKPFLFFFSFLFYKLLSAQIFPVKNYPKGYFVYPLKTAVSLAANFGELRPDHYHMGLDCKTERRENLPVYAAAGGYIARIRIEPFGFGRAIYINHPNGLTTVYAHLNLFFPALENYAKRQQYMQESWNIGVDIPPDSFIVKQNDIIAYSGNTGGSQGPHLHFEIRDTKTEKVLNPLLFGFKLKDDRPPSVTRLAIYDRCISTYNQIPRLLPLKFANGIYRPLSPLIKLNTDRVSFGISAVDTYTGSTNNNGIYEAGLFDNNTAIAGFQLDSISYDETRYENAHIDYRLRASGGPYVQHLSRLPGYPPGIYRDMESDGVISIDDDRVHMIKIVVKDANDNISTLEFQVQRNVTREGSRCKDPTAYFQPLLFHPGFVNVFEKEDIQLVLGEHDLYDSIKFIYTKKPVLSPLAVSDMHILHNATVPLHGYFTVRIKPSVFIPDSIKTRILMERSWNGKKEVFRAVSEGEFFAAKFRNLGNFQLVIDRSPPDITATGIWENANLTKASQIIFAVRDNNEKIKNFRAELDGKWLRFTNDKGRSFVYKFDEKCPPGDHELHISVEDEAGNVAERVFHFSR